MNPIGLILTIIVIGVLLWLAETYIPMAAPIKTILRIVVVVIVVFMVPNFFGLFAYLTDFNLRPIRR